MLKKYFIYKFGCQLNFADAEKIAGIMEDLGYIAAETVEAAGIVFLCTCAVRETAENRVWGYLGQLKKLKENNRDLKIALCGCMANESVTVEKIRKHYNFIDLVFGTGSIANIPKMLDELNTKKMVVDVSEYLPDSENTEPVRQNNFRALVPIMYGCNNFCTYCIVPYTRGRERSRDPKKIICEIRKLVNDGYKEIFLLGQNVNSYGKDLEDGTTFADLLKMIDSIKGDFWVRFISSHPKDISNELLDLCLDDNKIEPHLHLPVQSGSNEILSKMNRHYTIEKYMDIVKYLRERNHDFSITTDIIVGFPNETAEDFEKTLELVKNVKYDNIYSFIYSKRSGTKAALIDDKITDSEKSERMQKMLDIQRNITTNSYRRYIGKKMRILVDGYSKKGRPLMTGKNHEGIIVEFSSDEDLTGKFVNIEVQSSANWAVKGKLIKEI